MSASVERFLKTIYQIVNDYHEKANPSVIAGKLKISNAAVTDMARKLANKQLIYYEKYREISLTKLGHKMALRTIRKHRLWELFLSTVFKLNMSQIHQEAEMLEHETSDFLTDRIEAYLGFPFADPHGDPIPDKNGIIHSDKSDLTLSNVKSGKKYIIKRLNADSISVLNFLNENNFRINKTIKVLQHFELDNSVLIKIENTKIVLNHQVASSIYVWKIKK